MYMDYPVHIRTHVYIIDDIGDACDLNDTR